MDDIKKGTDDFHQDEQIIKKDDITTRLQQVIDFDVTPGKEIRLPHPSQKRLPILPEKVGEMFPAIIHDLYSIKGRIYDDGRKIKWFVTQQDAIQKTMEAQKEAESFYITKKFFDNFKSTVPQTYSRVDDLEMSSVISAEEILRCADIEKFKFVEEIIKHNQSWSKLSEAWFDLPDNHLSFKKENGELIIARFLGRQKQDTKKIYAIVLENGADKKQLDQKIINAYNDKITEIQKTLKERFKQIDISFLGKYENLPRFTGKDIDLESAIFDYKRILEEDFTVSTMEEYWEMANPTEELIKFATKKINSQFILWTDFWGRSFDKFNQLIEEREILSNFGGHFRRMGNSGNEDFRVIKSNGEIRPPTSIKYRKGYFAEGEKYRDVVLSEEIALYRAKGYTADDHYFKICKMSKELTKEQIESIKVIQKEIGNARDGEVGISGEKSPSIDIGWLESLDETEHVNMNSETSIVYNEYESKDNLPIYENTEELAKFLGERFPNVKVNKTKKRNN